MCLLGPNSLSGKSHERTRVFRLSRLTAAQPNIFSTQPFSICLHISTAQKRRRHGQDDTGDANLATRWPARERIRHQEGRGRATQIQHLIDDDTNILTMPNDSPHLLYSCSQL